MSYDILPDGMSVEIGPDRARGGGAGLAGFFYGWPRGGGGSGDLDGPLEQEAGVLGRFAAEAIEEGGESGRIILTTAFRPGG